MRQVTHRILCSLADLVVLVAVVSSASLVNSLKGQLDLRTGSMQKRHRRSEGDSKFRVKGHRHSKTLRDRVNVTGLTLQGAAGGLST